jgi:hypothetical protein
MGTLIGALSLVLRLQLYIVTSVYLLLDYNLATRTNRPTSGVVLSGALLASLLNSSNGSILQ